MAHLIVGCENAVLEEGLAEQAMTDDDAEAETARAEIGMDDMQRAGREPGGQAQAEPAAFPEIPAAAEAKLALPLGECQPHAKTAADAFEKPVAAAHPLDRGAMHERAAGKVVESVPDGALV